MTTKTRYFVIVSLLVLTVGLGTGLLAYYVGFPTSALTNQGGPAELQFIPSNASVVAFANVHEIMTSDLRQKARTMLPMKENGQQEFENQTGINIETDIDRVVVAMAPAAEGTASLPGSSIVLARGRFDQVKIEALMREHGAQVEQYKDTRIIVSEPHQGQPAMSLAFLEPGLAAVGGAPLIRSAVDLKAGGASVTTNDEVMSRIRDLESGNAWAVGRMDALPLPAQVSQKLPTIQWFSASAHIDSGVRAVVRAETRDETSANALRDVVRGIMALAKLQTSSMPALDTLLRSFELGGTGQTVSLSFDMSSDVIDALGALAKSPRQVPAPQH